ncbi:hypothetical protein FOA52_007613 [Chlamydomonas sp. UWO 241]|nr:hypothetical protein FOA52_007613 [Chlamydomonas sp. UWO 241]
MLTSTRPLGAVWDENEALSYIHFRRHAAFVPELGDFGLTERQCGRMLAESGLGMSGLGLGDVRILFKQLAKEDCVTYNSAAQIYKLLVARRHRVAQRVEAERAEEARLEGARGALLLPRSLASLELGGGGGGAAAAARGSGGAAASTGGSGGAAASAGSSGGRAVSGSGGTGPRVAADKDENDDKADRAAGGMSGARRFALLVSPPVPGSVVSPSSPSSSLAGGRTAHPLSASFDTPSSSRPSSSLLRGSPYTSGAPYSGGYAGLRALSASSTSGRNQPLSGMEAILTKVHPPVLLREAFPPPACEFQHVKSKLKGVREMLSGREPQACLTALKDLYTEWEQADKEKREKQRGKRGGEPAGGEASGSDEIPPEGAIFMLLMGASCCAALGRYGPAARCLKRAEARFNMQLLGVDHPYYYCIFLMQGVVLYFDARYDDAASKFEAARELASTVAREKGDPTASKSAAVCLNNIGCCAQMAGRRAEAVASFRAALSGLRNSVGLHQVEAGAVADNLSKAVRCSFALGPVPPRPKSAVAPGGALRPTRPAGTAAHQPGSAQPGSLSLGAAGLPLTVAASGGRLQAFLRMVVAPPKDAGALTEAPKFATRSDGEEGMKKAAAKAKGKGGDKKAKDKDKKTGGAKKKKATKEFTIAYPGPCYEVATFGVANVSTAAKKKGGKKGSKKKVA